MADCLIQTFRLRINDHIGLAYAFARIRVEDWMVTCSTDGVLEAFCFWIYIFLTNALFGLGVPLRST